MIEPSESCEQEMREKYGAWVRMKEFAAELDVSKTVIHRLVKRGIIRGVQLGKVWRIPIAELVRVLKAQGRIE